MAFCEYGKVPFGYASPFGVPGGVTSIFVADVDKLEHSEAHHCLPVGHAN